MLEQAFPRAPVIVVICDNDSIHHARKVTAYLEEHPRLELLYGARYSPHDNPVERADEVEEHYKEGTVPDAPVEPSATGRRRNRKPAAKKPCSRAKDINFRPEGIPSLRDFATEKDPASNHERNLVAVYYLEEFLAIDSIEVGHVLAAYTECGWRSPNDPDNSLSVTASRKGWLETSDRKAIRITHLGRNTVQYDLPRSSATKSA